jgi:hypothetical protein
MGLAIAVAQMPNHRSGRAILHGQGLILHHRIDKDGHRRQAVTKTQHNRLVRHLC